MKFFAAVLLCTLFVGAIFPATSDDIDDVMKQMEEIMNEARQATDQEMQKIGNLATDATNQFGGKNLSGATQSMFSKVITMVKNGIEHCTGQVQSILQPGIDGSLSKISEDIKSKMSDITEMKDCVESNGKQLQDNNSSDSLVSCAIEPVKKITENVNKVVNLITQHVTNMVNNVMTDIQKCTQSSNLGLMRIFSSDNIVLCIAKTVKNVEFAKLELVKLVIEQIVQTVTEGAKEAAKVPTCSSKIFARNVNQVTDMGLTKCIPKQ